MAKRRNDNQTDFIFWSPVYNADYFEFMSLRPEELLNRLKIKKTELRREEEEAQTRMDKFFEMLRELLTNCQQRSVSSLN